MLPGLAHINENQLFAAIHPRLHIRRRDLQLIHLFSLPIWLALFEESENSLPCIMALHQHRQVYAFRFFELLHEIRRMEMPQCLARQTYNARTQLTKFSEQVVQCCW